MRENSVETPPPDITPKDVPMHTSAATTSSAHQTF